MAVNSRGGILNANLFFFSWASFITTIAIFIGYGQETSKVDLIANASPKAAYWAGICVSSLIVLASSTQTFVKGVTILGQIFDCQDGTDHSTLYCERLKFSMSLGVISAALSGFCCILSSKISASAHASGSIFSLFAWVFGVGFTTFGDKSPGNGVGNLFFGCWSSFILSLFMVSSSIKDCIVEVEEKKAQRKEQEHDNALDTDNSDADKGDAASMNAEEEKDVEIASPSEAPFSREKSMNNPAEQDTPQKSNVEVPSEESSQKVEEIGQKV
jgi:hypothetical protein